MAKSKYYGIIEPKLTLIEGWARNGLTIEQIAKNLGISKVTFYKYMNEHTELSERLKKGKEVIDIEVENALLKRALGYKYKETTREKILQKDSSGRPLTDIHGFPIYKLEVTKEVIKEVAPDTTAQIFWLKNREPDTWRDKQQIEQKIESTIKVDVTDDG